MNRVVSVLLVAFACLCTSVSSAAIYSGKEVNLANLHAALSERFNATKENSFVRVVNNGTKMMVAIDEEKELVVLRITFTDDTDKGRQKMMELCNRYNDEKVFGRFSVEKDGDICIDHFIAYDGSLDTNNLIGSVKWLYGLADSFIKELKI